MLCGEQISERESHALFSYAADNGIAAWDTAEMYPVPQSVATQGQSEAILGSWLQKECRDAHWITTKVAGPGSMPWLRGGPLKLSKKDILDAVDGSLRRLQTDFVDCVLLHWPDRCEWAYAD
jgi:aryl-alcohol dehydrogenase-like predicted oxidoreductase